MVGRFAAHFRYLVSIWYLVSLHYINAEFDFLSFKYAIGKVKLEAYVLQRVAHLLVLVPWA